jgi:hypothetical protein
MWHCTTCGEDTEFEQPTCVDGHTEDGGDCPEWACVHCGTALIVGDVRPEAAVAWQRAA